LRLFIPLIISICWTSIYAYENIRKLIIPPSIVSNHLCFSKIPKRYIKEIPSNPWFWTRNDINKRAKDIYDKANSNAIMEVISYIYAPKKSPNIDLAVVFIMRMNKILYKDELAKISLFSNRHKGEAIYINKFPIIVIIISKYRMQNLLDKIVFEMRKRLEKDI